MELEVCRHCNLGTLWVQVSLGREQIRNHTSGEGSVWSGAPCGVSCGESQVISEDLHPAPAEPSVRVFLISFQVKVKLSLGI